MPNQVTLAYQATATNATTAKLRTAMAAVTLYSSPTKDEVLGRLLGLTVASDTTAVGGSTITRTLVLNLSAAEGAPPFFQVHNPPPAGAQLAVYSSSGLDHQVTPPLLNPSGAHEITLSYTDSEGNAGTTTALLLGRTPVVLQLAAGTIDFGGDVTSFSVSLTGASGANVGQITLSVIEEPEGGFPDAPDASQSELLGAYQDAMQMLLGDAVAMIPPAYGALDPQFTGAVLTNLYSYTLSKALSTPVTAASPAFS